MICTVFLLGAKDFRDPTQPPNVINRLTVDDKTATTNLVLTATYIYPSKRFALINGKLFQPGDELGQFTIMAITPYSVELEGPQNAKEVLQLVTRIKQVRAP